MYKKQGYDGMRGRWGEGNRSERDKRGVVDMVHPVRMT